MWVEHLRGKHVSVTAHHCSIKKQRQHYLYCVTSYGPLANLSRFINTWMWSKKQLASLNIRWYHSDYHRIVSFLVTAFVLGPHCCDVSQEIQAQYFMSWLTCLLCHLVDGNWTFIILIGKCYRLLKPQMLYVGVFCLAMKSQLDRAENLPMK